MLTTSGNFFKKLGKASSATSFSFQSSSYRLDRQIKLSTASISPDTTQYVIKHSWEVSWMSLKVQPKLLQSWGRMGLKSWKYLGALSCFSRELSKLEVKITINCSWREWLRNWDSYVKFFLSSFIFSLLCSSWSWSRTSPSIICSDSPEFINLITSTGSSSSFCCSIN